MIAKGNIELNKFYLGSTEVSAIYLGEDLIWPTEVPFTTSDLTFPTNTSLTNTAQVFTPTAGAGFGHTGLDDLSLAANENGRIYFQMQGADCVNAVFGFNTANAQAGFAAMELAIDVAGSFNLFRFISNDALDIGSAVTAGRFYGIYRVGATFKIQESTDGLTWTDFAPQVSLFGLTFSRSDQVWVVCDLFSAGSAKLAFPKITQYETGNLARLFIQDGNSLGRGVLTNINDITQTNIGYQGYASLNGVSDTFYKNNSTAGENIQTNILGLPTEVFPLFGEVGNSFNKIIVAEIEGTNQIHGGSTGVETYDLMMEYVDDVLNEDARACVMVYCMPNCDPAYADNAERLIYNGLLLGTAETSRFKVVDLSGTAALNDATAYQNTTYYQADGIHLKQAGYDLLYSLAEPVLLSF